MIGVGNRPNVQDHISSVAGRNTVQEAVSLTGRPAVLNMARHVGNDPHAEFIRNPHISANAERSLSHLFQSSLPESLRNTTLNRDGERLKHLVGILHSQISNADDVKTFDSVCKALATMREDTSKLNSTAIKALSGLMAKYLAPALGPKVNEHINRCETAWEADHQRRGVDVTGKPTFHAGLDTCKQAIEYLTYQLCNQPMSSEELAQKANFLFNHCMAITKTPIHYEQEPAAQPIGPDADLGRGSPLVADTSNGPNTQQFWNPANNNGFPLQIVNNINSNGGNASLNNSGGNASPLTGDAQSHQAGLSSADLNAILNSDLQGADKVALAEKYLQLKSGAGQFLDKLQRVENLGASSAPASSQPVVIQAPGAGGLLNSGGAEPTAETDTLNDSSLSGAGSENVSDSAEAMLPPSEPQVQPGFSRQDSSPLAPSETDGLLMQHMSEQNDGQINGDTQQTELSITSPSGEDTRDTRMSGQQAVDDSLNGLPEQDAGGRDVHAWQEQNAGFTSAATPPAGDGVVLQQHGEVFGMPAPRLPGEELDGSDRTETASVVSSLSSETDAAAETGLHRAEVHMPDNSPASSRRGFVTGNDNATGSVAPDLTAGDRRASGVSNRSPDSVEPRAKTETEFDEDLTESFERLFRQNPETSIPDTMVEEAGLEKSSPAVLRQEAATGSRNATGSTVPDLATGSRRASGSVARSLSSASERSAKSDVHNRFEQSLKARFEHLRGVNGDNKPDTASGSGRVFLTERPADMYNRLDTAVQQSTPAVEWFDNNKANEQLDEYKNTLQHIKGRGPESNLDKKTIATERKIDTGMSAARFNELKDMFTNRGGK